MKRIQFYPSEELAIILETDAKKKGVSVSAFVTDLLNEHYGFSKKNIPNLTQLTTIVLKEVEEYLTKTEAKIQFDLNDASETYRNIEMTNGKKPSTVRASIGRSFGSKIGKEPFSNVRLSKTNDGKQNLSVNNALLYEKFKNE
ncbi:hypothetical protein F8154_04040 [Alkaliphilus pronyensis]|uniref:Uncharacterized protein n=1 Tax=Alkaliphilus pronyensis TaxID=1482732 RepID=A0A6I0F2M2_9FIRM|nr:hypothetical protein [Alkaliphilus pronyensis]KAB3536257.1 hypothetical protein F8154_04040 [Alkaliphilus pronyensis]